MNPAKQENKDPAVKALQVANRLTLKAINTKNAQALIFTILNDTVHMIRYDRALLWKMDEEKPKLLGISGESKISKNSQLVKKWVESVKRIKEPSQPQIMELESISKDLGNSQENNLVTTLLWLPIFVKGRLKLGLWLELWNTEKNTPPPKELMSLLMNFLIPGYGSAWEKHQKKYSMETLGKKKNYTYLVALGLVSLVLLIPVPLRIVAPCEIIPNDPVLITAPLEGIIENIFVDPGEKVNPGDVLFEYDKQIPLQELEAAQKEVQILQSELRRSAIIGLEQEDSRSELAILNLKLERQKGILELAEYHASRLTVTAPEDGVVMLENPDDWRGKPVKIGEKVLAISDPKDTKVRIWLPESDNVVLDDQEPITIFLNIDPENSREARLLFIANETSISPKNVPSFIAEAEWIEAPEDIKLGLKGTAVMYGEKVTIFYFLIRKPWGFIRNFLGF